MGKKGNALHSGLSFFPLSRFSFHIFTPAFSFAVCCLGLSAFLTQLALMREFVSAFSGNELVFGIVLGNWMLLTGIGSTLGKTVSRLRRPIATFLVAQLLIALLPIADVFLLRWLRNVVFLHGVEVGVTETVASCFVLLAPYCLVTGYVLTVACQIAATAVRPERDAASGSDSAAAEIGRVYLLDNLGNVLGGIAFLVVFVHLLSHFGMLYVAGALNLLSAALLAVTAGKRFFAAVAVVALAAIFGVAALLDLDDVSRRLEYAGQNVIFHGESPYGSLVTTEAAGQLNFIENGTPLFSTQNTEQIEESVHFAMAQRPRAKRVLLISGGVSGTAREILKYPVEAVDYVELDPLILDVARRYSARCALGRPSHSRVDQLRRAGLRAAYGAAVRRGDRQRARSVHVATESLLHARVLRRSPPDSHARRRAVVLAGNLRELSQPSTCPAHRHCGTNATGGISERACSARQPGFLPRLRRRTDGRRRRHASSGPA